MADGSELWPIPKFHFSVTSDGVGGEVGFQEVSGLKLSTEFIEYRAGNDQTYIKQRIPGLKSFENITLKKGMYSGDTALYEWFADVQTNVERREDITISLLSEEHEPLMTWTITRCFPISITFPDLNGEANEIAIEELEIAHEGITLEAG